MATNFSFMPAGQQVLTETNRRAITRPRRAVPQPTPLEEKTPAAVSVMVPDATGQTRPYKVQIDPDRMKVGPVSIALDNSDTSATRPRTVAPPPSDSDRASSNLNVAYEDLQHTMNDPAAKQPRWKSALGSIFTGLAQMGPIRDSRDLVGELSKAVTLGVAGAVDPSMGNKLARPYKVKLAEDRLKIARDVATTQSGIEHRNETERVAQERLDMMKTKEERLTQHSKEVNQDKGKKNLIAEWKGRENYDPDDSDEADDPNSLTNRAAKVGMTLGSRTKEKKTRPEFTSGGVRYWVDESNVAHSMADTEGDPVKDPDYDAKIKYRNARLKIAQSMLGIATSREERLKRNEGVKRDDRNVKIEADAMAGGAYEKLASDYEDRAKSESDPAMARLYTQKADEARKAALKLAAPKAAESTRRQTELEGILQPMTTEAQVRTWAKNQQKVTGKPVSEAAIQHAVDTWKALHP